MALKAGRRPDLGERIATGDVRPVSGRLLAWLTLGVVLVVAIAITALIIASSGTKFPKVIDNNTPSHLPGTASTSAPGAFPTP
jgi:hypothetical protein